jgi:hypothetical protein
MNLRNAILLLAALVVQIGAQGPEQSNKSQAAPDELEQAFRDAVRSRLPESSVTTASVFALKHSSVAVPVLVEALERELNGNDESSGFIRIASELIAYTASSDAIDAISELCTLDKARFSPLLSRSLDFSINRNREYELAFYAVQSHPSLSQGVGVWLKQQFTFPLSDKRLAQAILKREEAGVPPDRNELLLGLLDAGARERLAKTLEQVRATRQQQPR